MSLRFCESGLRNSDCHDRDTTICYTCGMPKCRECSVISHIPGRYRRCRICKDCLEDGMLDRDVARLFPAA